MQNPLGQARPADKKKNTMKHIKAFDGFLAERLNEANLKKTLAVYRIAKPFEVESEDDPDKLYKLKKGQEVKVIEYDQSNGLAFLEINGKSYTTYDLLDMAKFIGGQRLTSINEEAQLILSKDQDFDEVKKLLRTDKKADQLNFTHWESGRPLGSIQGLLISMFFDNTKPELVDFILRNKIKVANKGYFDIDESFLGENRSEIRFSVDDEELDQMLHSEFREEIEYRQVNGDEYYALPKRAFDRFIDLADSSGFDVDYEGSEDSLIDLVESSINEVNTSARETHRPSDFNYSREETDYHDRRDFNKEAKLLELGDRLSFVNDLRGRWNVTREGDEFVVTNDGVPNKEMTIGLSDEDDEYIYSYELKGVNRNPKTGPNISGHQGNYTIEKSRVNSNVGSLFTPGLYPYELWWI